jgi:hypothetical protein
VATQLQLTKFININIKIEEEDEEDSDDDDKKKNNDILITTRHVVTQYVITTNLHDKSCLGYSIFLGYDALTLGLVPGVPTQRRSHLQRSGCPRRMICMSFRVGLSLCMLIIDTDLNFVTDHTQASTTANIV